MDDLSFRDKGNDNQRRIIAKLCGCRLVTANEGNARVRLDMALLKTLASSDLLSGAHLYGFPSPDSDYDLRGVHVLPVAEVVGLDAGRETIEVSGDHDGMEMDLVTHDARIFHHADRIEEMEDGQLKARPSKIIMEEAKYVPHYEAEERR